jgi:hypothetical protein
VEPDEQLEWEQRASRPVGLAALAAAVLLMAGAVLSVRGAERHAFDTYLNVDKDPSIAYLPNVVQALGYLAAAVAMFYLARAATARRSEMAGPTRIMALVGPIATAIASVVLAFAIVKVAHQVGDLTPPRGNKARDDAVSNLQTDSGFYTTAAYGTLAARFALGFGLVLTSLNAMRAGLLSRFLGIIGIIAGVLTALISGAGVILAFWLVAVGIIVLNRWPGGRGPAWDEVEAIPWPSAMQLQQERLEAAAAERADEDVADEDGDYEEVDEQSGTEPGDAHPVSKKRKRKRRR